MNQPIPTPLPDTTPRSERLQRGIAAALSVLLHVLFMLLVLHAARQERVTTPQGAASGGRVRVDFVGEPAESPDTRAPPSPAPGAPPKSASTREARRPVPPRPPVPRAGYIERVEEASEEAAVAQRDERSRTETTRPPASSPAPARRRPHEWTGRPPGLLQEDTGPMAGPARGPANRSGRARDLDAAEPSVEVGGYQIVYDLLAEERLRSWKEQGMEEISFPLPGLRSRMVCPLEIALRRESGKCRLLDPNDPAMQGIGDARQVVVVLYVYHLGELVWRGPGPYR